MGTITKKDLVDLVADASRLKRTDVRDTLQCLLDIMVEQLGRGHRLEFRDFGVFEVRARKARKAQNPRTLEPVTVPPKRTVKFKPGRLMRDRMDAPQPVPVKGKPTPSAAHAGLNGSANGSGHAALNGTMNGSANGVVHASAPVGASKGAPGRAIKPAATTPRARPA